jgi:hypothetical protein
MTYYRIRWQDNKNKNDGTGTSQCFWRQSVSLVDQVIRVPNRVEVAMTYYGNRMQDNPEGNGGAGTKCNKERDIDLV